VCKWKLGGASLVISILSMPMAPWYTIGISGVLCKLARKPDWCRRLTSLCDGGRRTGLRLSPI